LYFATWLRGERTVHIVANCVLATAVYGETTGGIISEHCLGGYPAVRGWAARGEKRSIEISASWKSIKVRKKR